MAAYGKHGERGGGPPRGNREYQGRGNQSCTLKTNLFKYTGEMLTLHRYAVTFTPEVRRRDIFERFMQIAQRNGLKENFAFDGNAVLVTKEKMSDKVFETPIRDGVLVCRVEYKCTVSMNNKEQRDLAMNSLEVLYKHYQRMNFHSLGRSCYNSKALGESIGPGIEIRSGLSSVMKSTGLGLFLNLDIAYCVFFKSKPLIELMQEMAENSDRVRPVSSPLEYDATFYNRFERVVRSIMVITNHRERNSKFKPAGILMRRPGEIEFETENGKKTVAEYFAERYGPLKYLHLPVVVIRRRGCDIYMPMEVLDVVPMQKYTQRLNECESSQMIKIAATKPNVRFKLIEEKAAELGGLQNKMLKDFGICFDNRMLNCQGKILTPPSMIFRDNNRVAANRGSWNLINVAAVTGSDIQEWKVFAFKREHRVGQDQLKSFVSQAQKYGISFGRPVVELVNNMEDFARSKKAFFNLVILPDRSAQRYEEIKKIAETHDGCYTQCILSKNLRSLSNPSFVANLLLKINTKLGGKNWVLKERLFGDKETILIGIDVEHPGVGDNESLSVVGIVASMDYDFVTYSSVVKQQTSRQEIVCTLQGVVKDMLKRHYASTKKKPQRIIVFRDGVGESMFDSVFEVEISSVRAACADLSFSYKPEINFVVAQKRHSIRFMDSERNPQPGTVVDQLGSSSSAVYDFFMVSHSAIQGTARPVRYICLLNESKFSMEQLYTSIFSLCHLYMRATKSVSLVPPVYYAHLAAARGRCYVEVEAESGALRMLPPMPVFEKSLYFL